MCLCSRSSASGCVCSLFLPILLPFIQKTARTDSKLTYCCDIGSGFLHPNSRTCKISPPTAHVCHRGIGHEARLLARPVVRANASENDRSARRTPFDTFSEPWVYPLLFLDYFTDEANSIRRRFPVRIREQCFKGLQKTKNSDDIAAATSYHALRQVCLYKYRPMVKQDIGSTHHT